MIITGFNFYYDIAACLINLFIVFGLFWKKGGVKESHNRLFIIIIASSLVSCCARFAMAFFLNHHYEGSLDALFFWSFIYHFSHIIYPLALLFYVSIITGIDKKAHNRAFYALVSIPTVFCFIALIVNLFTKSVYYYTFENGYFVIHNSLLMFIIMAIGFAYGFMTLILFLIDYKNVIKGVLVSYFLLTIISFVSFFGQFFTKNQPFMVLFTQSLCQLCLLFFYENQDDLYNNTTGRLNLKALIQDFTNICHGGKRFQAIVIRLENYSYYSSTIGVDSLRLLRKKIGDILYSLLPENGVLYDCSKGMFTIIFPYKNAKNTLEEAERINNCFSKPFGFDGNKIYFTTTISPLSVPEDISSSEELITIINNPPDIASSSSLATITDKQDLQGLIKNNKIRTALQTALDNDTLEVYFQPVVNMKTNKIETAEALVRLDDPDIGAVPPQVFIPIAEKAGLINVIGERIFEKICQFLNSHQEDVNLKHIDYNFSILQCLQTDFLKRIKRIINYYSIDPKLISFEITESEVVNLPALYESLLKEINKLGFNFLLDDYGVGYFNTVDLYSHSFSGIKLDRSILWNADFSPKSDILLSYTVKTLKELGLEISIIGVENMEHIQKAKNLQVDYIQGFAISEALPYIEFINFVRRYNSEEHK